jgi:hypothetical protein
MQFFFAVWISVLPDLFWTAFDIFLNFGIERSLDQVSYYIHGSLLILESAWVLNIHKAGKLQGVIQKKSYHIQLY